MPSARKPPPSVTANPKQPSVGQSTSLTAQLQIGSGPLRSPPPVQGPAVPQSWSVSQPIVGLSLHTGGCFPPVHSLKSARLSFSSCEEQWQSLVVSFPICFHSQNVLGWQLSAVAVSNFFLNDDRSMVTVKMPVSASYCISCALGQSAPLSSLAGIKPSFLFERLT